MKKKEVINMSFKDIDLKKLEISYAGRHDTIKSVYDVERRIMVLNGTTKLRERDKELAKFFFNEIQRIREMGGEI
jgi:hypothetical protein